MFINYFRDWKSATEEDLRPLRWLFGFYIIWKFLSYYWFRLDDWPEFILTPFGMEPDLHLTLLLVEVPIVLICMILFTLGRYVRVTAPLLAVLLTHLVGIHLEVTNSGVTWLPPIYLLALYGVFHDDERQVYRWGLLIMALIYFFTGYAKLIDAGPEWIHPNRFIIMLHQEEYMHLGELPATARWIMQSDWIASATAAMSIFLEVGLLFAVLFRLPLWPFFLGLAGMHFGILIAMKVWFFDQYLVYLLFVRWSRVREFIRSRFGREATRSVAAPAEPPAQKNKVTLPSART